MDGDSCKRSPVLIRRIKLNLMAFHFLFIAGIAVVYDSIEPSPYYGGTANDMYLDEKELIELPSPH